MKTIIIGGVAGGATTAARLRRLDENAEIILLERGEYVSYANCGLPYYIGDKIKDRNNLLILTKEGFINRFNINIRNNNEVVKINPKEKTIEIKNIKTNETYTEPYDKLVISTGAEPIKPPMEGIKDSRIFSLRNIPDMDYIKQQINEYKPKKALVVGGGFVGLEMIENLRDLGLEVTLIERSNQVMTPIDLTMATIVHEELRKKGVELIFNESIQSFTSSNNNVTAHLESGKSIDGNMIILSIGVKPESKLAIEAGLKTNANGAIVINDYMQTSDNDIYALGDVVEVLNPVIGKRMTIPLAGPANKQGRIVANNIVEGNKYTYNGTIGTSIAKVFDLTVASVGVSTKVLDRENIDYEVSITHGTSHASYYPGALPMTIQLIFEKQNGKIYGAQIVGYEGVDKRIDLIAQVVKNGGTIYDLQEIEHAYAPPYSSAKDPINMAGFVADNILSDKVKVVQWHQLDSLIKEEVIIIDARTSSEYEMGHIDGAINIPVDEMRKRLSEIPKDKKIVVYCAVGLRGYLASRILLQNGYSETYNLSGGYKTYSVAIQKNDVIKKIVPQMITELKTNDNIIKIDACGLQCPGPIMQLKKHYDRLNAGDQLQITVTDQAFGADLTGWANMVGATILDITDSKGVITANIEKGEQELNSNTQNNSLSNAKTLVVFSDDLDRALASFVIANGAAASGKKVSMFFTFWGLNVIKKQNKPAVKKDFLGKMFDMMLPANSKKLSLSKINMGGMGSKMMRYIMKSKDINSLESLIQQAKFNGVEMIACSMSMDVMGVKKEELMDNVTIGGVAAYLDRTDKSGTNLFI